MSANLIYYHGGPGFNSHPEANILATPLKKRGYNVSFWNEPPVFDREGNALNPGHEYQALLDSADFFLLEKYRLQGKVHLFGHSFGANVVTYLVQKRPQLISSVTFTAPGLNVHEADKNILGMGLADLTSQEEEEERAEELRGCLEKMTMDFDDTKVEAYNLALHPEFFFHYFESKDVALNFLQYFSGANEVSIPAYYAVRKSMFPAWESKQSSIPATVIFGENDPVINQEAEKETLQELFCDLSIHVVKGSRHYPHIGAMDQVLKLLSKA